MRRALLLAAALSPHVAVAAEASAHEWSDSPSPATALALSLGTTLGGMAAGAGLIATAASDEQIIAGVAIGGLALLAGPSTGVWYAGERRQWTAWTRLGLGAASLASFTAAVAIGVGCALASESNGDCGSDADGFAILGTLFAVGVVGLATYDIIDAPFAARRSQRSPVSLGLSPRRGGGLLSAGLRF